MNGKIVKHKIFGEGTVVSLKDNFLTVKFPEKEIVLMFPDCFENLITTEDKELSAYAELLIYNKHLEDKHKKDMHLKNRINPRRGNALRWHSYTSNRVKAGKTLKSPPKENSVKEIKPEYKRYKGENCFVYTYSESFDEALENGKIELDEKVTLAEYVDAKDIILCKKNNISHIGVVLSNTKETENNSHILSCQFIPILGEVSFEKNEGIFVPCTADEMKTILNKIKEVCPYIVSIEGIGHLI